MQRLAKLYRLFVWLVFIITASVQILASIGIWMKDTTSLFNPLFLLAATGALTLGVVFFFLLRRFKTVPFAITVLAGIAHIVLALMIKKAFPLVVHPLGNSTGISMWDTVLRHMTPMLVPLLLAPLWWQYLQDRLAEKRAKQAENTPSYFDLLDESYRMRALDDDEARMPKPKRSMRRRKENTK